MNSILLKVLIAAATALLGAIVMRTGKLARVSDQIFLRSVVALQLLPTAALFLALYVVGHAEVTSDVPGYYLPVARATLAGQVPFRDFPLSYAPLFPYVGAAIVSVWNSGKVFALLAIGLNLLALLCWHQAARTCLDRSTARDTSILYASSGHLVVQALLGTSQIWIAAALAATALLTVRNRSAAAGLVQAVSLCTTKFLALLFWPVLLICAPRRGPWLVAAVVTSAVVYGAFASTGADLLYPLRFEETQMSSGNLPYLLDPSSSVSAVWGRFFDALALAALVATISWLYLRTRPVRDRARLVAPALALVGLVFMIFSKKSFTGYAAFFMYPMVWVLATRIRGMARAAFLLVFNVLLVAEPSLWFYLEGFNIPLRGWLASGASARGYAFLLVDLALLACYIYLAWLSVLCVRSMVAGAISPRNSIQSAAACSVE